METQTGFLLELLLGSWAASGLLLDSFWSPFGLLLGCWAASGLPASGLLLGCFWAASGLLVGPSRPGRGPREGRREGLVSTH
jgi:hypothetical protein